MNNDDLVAERKQRAALRRLATDNPLCTVCGVDDPRCLELHHLARSAYDDLKIILCRNCHRKQSDPTDNMPAPEDPPLMVKAAQFLLGLARLFVELAAKCEEYGAGLLEGANVCPRPYGWVTAPETGTEDVA